MSSIVFPSRVFERIASNQPARGVALHIRETAVFEMVAGLGFDAIWVDQEHHLPGPLGPEELFRAARAGGPTDIVARCGNGEFAQLSRLLEAGAHGIMYPCCTSVEEALEVVRWAKFPPLGRRGVDGSNADGDYLRHSLPDYLARANGNTFLIIQLEERASVDLAGEIARIDGVDMLMLGPADFSVKHGFAGQFDHPLVVDAQQRVADAAKAAGKNWAATATTPEHACRFVRMGAALVFYGTDLCLLREGFQAISQNFACGQSCNS